MIIFGPPRNGWAVAPERSSRAALKNTNELIEQTLGAIKVVVGQRNGNITPDELREFFLDSELYAAAGSNDWAYFIDAFRPPSQTKKPDKRWKMPTPKEVARIFLARATNRTPSTIKKNILLAMKSKKHKKTRKAPFSTFQ